MRKSTVRIATFTAIIVLCLIFPSGITTAATSVSILPSSQAVEPEENFTLQVYIKPDTAIYGLQLDLTYDSSLVTINSIEEGDLFADSGSPIMFNPGKIDESAGTVSQIYSALIMGEGATNEGIFCTINLVAEPTEGICELRITNVVLGDNQGKELPATTLDSIISITDTVVTEEKNDKNKDDETELNIIPVQDDEQETQKNVNGEQMFASTPDQAENSVADKTIGQGSNNSKTSNWINIIFIAIAFFGIAYFLDRKK
ncbi:cohesin domain-containing protein [Methanolobus psychrotolerans]|uniref:cohesin domain-containing protein n=1 Tax=Methanolobus psychrotolerans TaxID=1874706 RepID=UPI000B915769|nr:cohesin domain-containing protein [Methanolobus psychrotolerans]